MSESLISIIVRANHVLALARCGRAARLWQRQEMSRAAAELKAAAQYAQDAAQWLNSESRPDLHAVADAARAAAAKLEAGAECSGEEINDILIGLREALDSIPHRFGFSKEAS